jgi:hypothetical protein
MVPAMVSLLGVFHALEPVADLAVQIFERGEAPEGKRVFFGPIRCLVRECASIKEPERSSP